MPQNNENPNFNIYQKSLNNKFILLQTNDHSHYINLYLKTLDIFAIFLRPFQSYI